MLEATRVCTPIEIVIRANNNLFNAHQMLKDQEGMLRAIGKSLMLQPQNAELHKYRALLLRDMGNYVAAAEALEHYLGELFPILRLGGGPAGALLFEALDNPSDCTSNIQTRSLVT